MWEVSQRSFLAGAMASPLRSARRIGPTPRPARHRPASGPCTAGPTPPSTTPASCSTPTGTPPTRVRRRSGRRRRWPASPTSNRALGAWYVDGGLGRLADALVELAVGVGVDIRTGTDVSAIIHEGERVAGVRLADGERIAADAVVANVDALHLYRDLLPHRRAPRRAEAAPRSSSGFVLLLGVEGPTDGPGPPQHLLLRPTTRRVRRPLRRRHHRPPTPPSTSAPRRSPTPRRRPRATRTGSSSSTRPPAPATCPATATTSSTCSPTGAGTWPDGSCTASRSRPPTSRRATGHPAARSTGPRRTAPWPRSCARATEARSTACTCAAAAATPAAGSRWWPQWPQRRRPLPGRPRLSAPTTRSHDQNGPDPVRSGRVKQKGGQRVRSQRARAPTSSASVTGRSAHDQRAEPPVTW